MDTGTQTRFSSRPVTADEDLQPLCDFLNMCDTVDQLDEEFLTPDELRVHLTNPDINRERDVRVWEDEAGRASQVVGYGLIWFGKQGEEPVADGHFTFRVHPDTRNIGLEEEILEFGCGRAREIGKERNLPAVVRSGLHYRSPEYIAYRQDVLERNGFAPVRYWFKMARDLHAPIPEPALPDGFTVRPTEGVPEAEQWIDVFNQSFIDHWNHHDETVESHKHWLENEPNYNKARDLVCIAPDGTWAAFCFCMIYANDNEARNRKEGWIDILGTRRGYRKMGLGTAMLLAGLHKLKEDGMDTAALGVDAENPTGALRLYKSVGFYEVSSTATYSKDVTSDE